METLIAHPDTKAKLKALVAVLEALNIDYEDKSTIPYSKAFLTKMENGDKARKAGLGKKVDPNNLWK